MAKFTFNPAEYTETEFAIVPTGDHRVRIFDVVEKTFSSGSEGYEIVLEVSGHSSRLWYYLVINAADPKITNQRLGAFFNSFGITDYDLNHYASWVGKVGAVRVKHEKYNGSDTAKVAFLINRDRQDKLPEWQGSSTASASGEYVTVADEDLPF